MPKIIYDYVMYRLDDPAQLPIRYLTINEISKLTGKSKKSLHNQFNVLNGVVWEWYGIERFRKEEEGLKELQEYEDLSKNSAYAFYIDNIDMFDELANVLREHDRFMGSSEPKDSLYGWFYTLIDEIKNVREVDFPLGG